MKKKILSLSLIFVVMFVILIGLTACGNDEEDEEESSSSTTENITEEDDENLSTSEIITRKNNKNSKNEDDFESYKLELSEMEVSTFNAPFTQYEGKQIGSSVKSLLDKVIANCSTFKDNDDKLLDIVYVDNGKGPIFTIDSESIPVNGSYQIESTTSDIKASAIQDLRNNIASTHYYTVGFETDLDTGLINEIIIKF